MSVNHCVRYNTVQYIKRFVNRPYKNKESSSELTLLISIACVAGPDSARLRRELLSHVFLLPTLHYGVFHVLQRMQTQLKAQFSGPSLLSYVLCMMQLQLLCIGPWSLQINAACCMLHSCVDTQGAPELLLY